MEETVEREKLKQILEIFSNIIKSKVLYSNKLKIESEQMKQILIIIILGC